MREKTCGCGTGVPRGRSRAQRLPRPAHPPGRVPITGRGGRAVHPPGGSDPSLPVTSSELPRAILPLPLGPSPPSQLRPRPPRWALAPASSPASLPPSLPTRPPRGSFHTLPLPAPSPAPPWLPSSPRTESQPLISPHSPLPRSRSPSAPTPKYQCEMHRAQDTGREGNKYLLSC